MQLYVYCDNPEQTIHDCIEFLKTNDLYKCEFDVVLNDNGDRLSELI